MDAENPNYKQLVTIGFFVLVLFGIYQIVSAAIAAQNTGVLSVTASKPGAVISVSRANKQAAIIGTGSARVRLAPGTYQLVAVNAGSRTASLVKITEKHSSRISLDLNKTSTLRSVASINFEGTDALVNNGLTATQVGELEQYFFQLKPSANKVVIDTASVQIGPHDLNTSTFTLNFNVAVDSSAYKSTVSYADPNAVRLQLYEPRSGSQVLDSDALPADTSSKN